MRLSHLSLHNFRNYVRLDLDLPPGVAVLLGDNAQGKTNLLEAVFYLATSRSPHAGADRELVNWLTVEREPLPYARLVGRVARGPGTPGQQPVREMVIEITLTREGGEGTTPPAPLPGGEERPSTSAGGGWRTAASGERYRKQIRLNGVPKRAMDLLGHLNVVLFLPDDIELVPGSPGLRRRYLDVMLCQIDPHYCAVLARYNEVVAQRNALLRDLRERGGDPGQLQFWDERLVEHGTYLIARRQRTVVALDELTHHVHAELTGGMERLHLRYLPSVGQASPDEAPAIAAAFQGQVHSLRGREIAAGVTLAGPHRDEVRFLIDDVDAGVFGSRGQQRTAALALKLAEVDLMHGETGEYPVLLLDDVLSELDTQRRQFLLHRLDDGPEQVILTTSDLHLFPGPFLNRCRVWRIEMGRLKAV